MKKTNFFKLLMVGALTLSLGLSGCNFVKESEIEDICETIDLMKTDIAGLNTRLNAVEAGNYVTDVTKVDGNTIRVSYKTGTPVEIKLDGIGGPGPELPAITIGSNGNWYFDGEDSGYSVFGPAPKVEDGKWLFPVMTEDGVEWEEGEDAIYNAYVTKANGVYTLYITDSATGELTPIQLPSASSGVTNIELKGWVQGFEAKDNLASTETAEWGKADELRWEAPLYVFWSRIANSNGIKDIDGDETGETNVVAGTQRNAWNHAGANGAVQGGARVVKGGSVLNTLGFEKKGVVAQVSPATADLSTLEGWTLQNSKNEILPIAFGKPQLISGYLTRGEKAASNALYFFPGTFDEAATVDADNKFTDPFNQAGAKDKEWSLVAPDGQRRSNYGIVVMQKAIASYEGNIEELSPASSTDPDDLDDLDLYSVIVNKEYTIKFADNVFMTEDEGEPEGEAEADNEVAFSNAVVDHYIQVKEGQLDVDRYGVKFNDSHTAFTISVMPDKVTIAPLVLVVKKLGVDGKVYTEEIAIRAVRSSNVTTIDLDEVNGDYFVQDEYPAVAADYLATPITVDLAPMFADLKSIADGNTNLETLWKSGSSGVKKYVVRSLEIEGEPNNANPNTKSWPLFTTGVAKTDDVDLKNKHINDFAAAVEQKVVDDPEIKTTGVAVFAGIGGNNNGTTWNIQPDAVGAVNDFRKIKFWLPYATGAAKPSFKPGKVHTMTIDFFDGEGDLFNTLVLKFTPKLPALADMFKKETQTYWKDGVLQAYYKEPASWEKVGDDGWNALVGKRFYTGTIGGDVGVGTANSTYYGVYNGEDLVHAEKFPADGGFTAAGKSSDPKRWIFYADLALKDGKAKIDGKDAETLVSTIDPNAGTTGWIAGSADIDNTKTYANVVMIKNQTDKYTDSPIASEQHEDGKDNAYGEVLNMKWNVGPYLGFYNYDAADVTAQDFSMKIMSAMAEGTITTTTGSKIEIPFAAIGEYAMVTKEHIQLVNYNKAKYSIFTDKNGKYTYNYIRDVVFSRPENFTGYEIFTLNEAKEIVAAPGTGRAIPAGVLEMGEDEDGGPVFNAEGMLLLKPMNGSSDVDTTIIVKVYDRFGRMKEGSVQVVLTIAE